MNKLNIDLYPGHDTLVEWAMEKEEWKSTYESYVHHCIERHCRSVIEVGGDWIYPWPVQYPISNIPKIPGVES